jgi:hypothetical protein
MKNYLINFMCKGENEITLCEKEHSYHFGLEIEEKIKCEANVSKLYMHTTISMNDAPKLHILFNAFITM